MKNSKKQKEANLPEFPQYHVMGPYMGGITELNTLIAGAKSTAFTNGINGDGCDEFITSLTVPQLIELWRNLGDLDRVEGDTIYLKEDILMRKSSSKSVTKTLSNFTCTGIMNKGLTEGEKEIVAAQAALKNLRQLMRKAKRDGRIKDYEDFKETAHNMEVYIHNQFHINERNDNI